MEKIFDVVMAVIAAATNSLPVLNQIPAMIEALFESKELTLEERDNLHQAVKEAIARREARIPLTEKYAAEHEGDA